MSERQGKFNRVQRILIWAVFPVLLPSRWKSTDKGSEAGINIVHESKEYLGRRRKSHCWKRLLGLIW